MSIGLVGKEDVVLRVRQVTADAVNLWNDAAGQIRAAGIGGAPELRQRHSRLP